MRACKNCGFLAQKDEITAGSIEVPPSVRENPSLHRLWPWPVCYVAAFNLKREVQEVHESDLINVSDSIAEVIQKDRSDCWKWTQWSPGLSAREHLLMLDKEKEREQEERRWRLGVIVIGSLLVLATLAGPILAVLIEHRFFGSN